MDDTMDETKYIEYYKSKIDPSSSRKSKKTISKEVDNLEIQNTGIFNSYPDHNNPDFVYGLSNKLEFFHMKSLLNITDLSNKCKSIGDPKSNDFQFELSNNQQFLKNFINKKTPYRGLVIFHGVGVGKTCSAINISSSFRDLYMSKKEKIICLVPKNIRGGWENTIYDKTKGVEQCSGDSFEDIIMDASNKGKVSNKVVKNMIKNYYEFYGYLKFANHVKRLISDAVGNRDLTLQEMKKKEEEVIKNNFSHRILIIDEIHNLREENDEANKTDMNYEIKKGTKIIWEDSRSVSHNGKVIKVSDGNLYDIQIDGAIIENVSANNIKKSSIEDKKARETIEKVIKYSEGLRLIMLSATPMFNKSTEIVWLLNLLLKNDNRPEIDYSDIFKKKFIKVDGKLKQDTTSEELTAKGKEIIAKKSRGYFSYLRGENPISFPIRFYPDVNDDPKCMGGDFNSKIPYLKYPTQSLFLRNGKHLPIKNKYEFKFMKMYNTVMTNKQKDIYESFIASIDTSEIKKNKGLRLSDRNIGLQLSNITYSEESSYEHQKSFGKNGFNRIFKQKIERKRKLCSYNNPKNPILDIENIQSVSAKIYTILMNMLVNKTEGIIFIYSDFIYSGILPLALALEHIGFEKYGGNNLLNYPEWKKGSKDNKTKREPLDYKLNLMSKSKNKKRARYIVLTGDKSLSPDNESERKASLHENNIYGENIKVILGNTVTSEGMDFKNIREVHVLDPWYHLYKIEQIIGRGIRFCSHGLQPKEKQNVTVYLHTSSINPDIESIDTDTYRMAEEKASRIGEIEKIIKENAIDSFLNKQINNITDLEKIKMVTTSNKPVLVDINDKEYTKVCSFSSSEDGKGCEIIDLKDKKWNKLLNSIKDDGLIDTDTFTIEDISESVKIIYKVLKELFIKYNVYSLDDIIKRVKTLIDTNEKIIYHSLESIIDNKMVIWYGKISGYIIENREYYLFQPFYNKDIYTPYIYRTIYESLDDNKNYNYSTDLQITISGDINCNLNYNDIYEILKNKLEQVQEDMRYYMNYIPEIKPDKIIDYYVDGLKYEEKLVLLKEILCEYINSGGEIIDEIDKIVFNFFKKNLIYKDDSGGYHILDEKKGNPIGFFLFNTIEYYKNPKKEVLDDFTYFEYFDDEWSEIDNVGLNILKQNFLNNESKKKIFRSTKIWGYSFKDENYEHTFKIIDSATYDNKVPGKIIGNKGVKPVTLLKQYSDSFKSSFDRYQNDLITKIKKNIGDKKKISDFQKSIDGKEDEVRIKILLESFRKYGMTKDYDERNKNIISKSFIKDLFEFSLRVNFTFLNYDLFLLKYIS